MDGSGYLHLADCSDGITSGNYETIKHEIIRKGKRMAEPILSAREICKSFGSNSVLENVSVDFYPGEVHALLGVNGAGKSTLVKILQGIYQADSGKIFLNGQEVRFSGPSEAMDQGISMVFQELNLFGEMSVTENVMGHHRIKKNGLIDWKACRKHVRDLLADLKIDINEKVLVKKLPLASQQLIEIAKCINSNPKVIFLDEPSSSLSKSEEEILYELVKKLKERGIAVVLITHKMEEVFQLCDKLTILRDGKFVAEGPAKNFKMEEITEHMLGKAVEIFKKSGVTNGDPEQVMLEVKGLTLDRKFHDIHFRLYKGEILAFAGLVGSGKSDLIRTIFGANKNYEGQIFLEGREIHPSSPYEASQLGLGYVPISRKDEGILSNFNAKKNITSAMLDELGFWIDRKREKEIVDGKMEEFNVHPNDVNLSINNFSGGNQQKVVVSRWIAAKKKIVMLDEPTRGVDVGAKQEIYDNLKRLAAEGIGIIICSSETEELLSASDRIIIMREGHIVKELVTAVTTSEEILQHSIAAEESQAESK